VTTDQAGNSNISALYLQQEKLQFRKLVGTSEVFTTPLAAGLQAWWAYSCHLEALQQHSQMLLQL